MLHGFCLSIRFIGALFGPMSDLAALRAFCAQLQNIYVDPGALPGELDVLGLTIALAG